MNKTIDSDWDNFCLNENENDDYVNDSKEIIVVDDIKNKIQNFCIPSTPKSSSLYISTKTKISYLNKPINLSDIFWKIPLIPYSLPSIGVVKKQMKFNSNTQEELDIINLEVKNYEYVDEYVINQINNPDGRIKFKDIRKVSIGLCRKDIMSYRCKKKSAFYNCFVVIIRLLKNDIYKEIHVKVFNTGKLEIPGIQNDDTLEQVLDILTDILRPLVDIVNDPNPLTFLKHKTETVLINSNFKCGYFINREKLYTKLKYNYKINSAYDPCSYPGIQSEFYFDPELKEQTGMQPHIDKKNITKISFMIFRTGSVLIVGKCTESILYNIYEFLYNLFIKEFEHISIHSTAPKNDSDTLTNIPIQVKKNRKKIILI